MGKALKINSRTNRNPDSKPTVNANSTKEVKGQCRADNTGITSKYLLSQIPALMISAMLTMARKEVLNLAKISVPKGRKKAHDIMIQNNGE